MSMDEKISCEKVGDEWLIEMPGSAPITTRIPALAYKIHQLAKNAYWSGRKDLQAEFQELIGAKP